MSADTNASETSVPPLPPIADQEILATLGEWQVSISQWAADFKTVPRKFNPDVKGALKENVLFAQIALKVYCELFE
jgi:hypothetical protein